MSISSLSGIDSVIVNSASNLKGSQVKLALQTAVLKQTLDQQKAAGEALVKMISQGIGQNIDLQA